MDTSDHPEQADHPEQGTSTTQSAERAPGEEPAAPSPAGERHRRDAERLGVSHASTEDAHPPNSAGEG